MKSVSVGIQTGPRYPYEGRFTALGPERETQQEVCRTQMALSPGISLDLNLVSGKHEVVARSSTGDLPAQQDLDRPVELAGHQLSSSALAAAVRLVVLRWTWQRIPVPTPGPVWQIEAAALAAICNFPSPVAAARAGLVRAVAEFARGVWKLPPSVSDGLSCCARHLAENQPGLPPPAVLAELTEGLRALVTGRVRTRPSPEVIGPTDPLSRAHGRFEVAWNRVPPFQLDPREAAANAWPSTGGIQVVVGAMRTPSWLPIAPVWARVLSQPDNRLLGVKKLNHSGEYYTGLIELPRGANGAWTVDIVGDPDLSPLNPPQWLAIRAEQALMRALLLDRACKSRPELRRWRDVARTRYGALGCVSDGSDPSWPIEPTQDSFVAERLVDPAVVTLLSPGQAPVTH